MKKLKLEEEEKKILESFERDEWEPVADLEKEVKKHQVYACLLYTSPSPRDS